MARANTQDILSSLLKDAKTAGADAADALFVENVAASVSYRLGRLEDVERAESHDLGLRVFVGQKVAFISSTDLSRESLSQLASRAVTMAKLAPEDKFAGLAPKDMLAKDIPALESGQSEPSADTAGRLGAPGRRARRWRCRDHQLRGRRRVVRTDGGGAGDDRIYGGYAGTNCGIGVAVVGSEGTGMERDYIRQAPGTRAIWKVRKVGRTAGSAR